MDRNENYRRVLKAGLQRRGMTQKQLGALVGLSQHTISDYVCGKSVPSIGDAAAIAQVLSFSLDATFYLRENEGTVHPSALEWSLLQLFRQVSAHQQKAVLDIVRCALEIALRSEEGRQEAPERSSWEE